MFPSHGYFFSVSCPEITEGKCQRPYCHFHHDEKLFAINEQKNAAVENTTFDGSTDTLPYKQDENVTTNGNGVVTGNSVVEVSPLSSSSTSLPTSNSATTSMAQNEKVEDQEVFKEICSHPTSSTSGSNTDIEDSASILQQLVSEAVKKVLSENAGFNSALLDPDAILKGINAQELVTKAVKGVSDANTKEKKISKLYLPPPGTPAYKPTPISQLISKTQKMSDSSIPNDEYTPCAVVHNETTGKDDEITDFSSDEEDNSRSDFDMLEEVWAECSTDPLRRKAILKRKKALGRLSSKKLSLNSPSKKLKISDVESCSKLPPNDPTLLTSNPCSESSDSTFRPPSPIFTSSNEKFSLGLKVIKGNAESKSKASLKKPDSVSPIILECQKGEGSTFASPSITKSSFAHNHLPQITELLRPNVKAWSPVPKVDSLLSVEKMLEQLDSLSVDKRDLWKSNLNISVCDKDLKPLQQNLDKCKENGKTESTTSQEKEVDLHEKWEKTLERKDACVESDSSQRKRYCDSVGCLEPQRKKKKAKELKKNKKERTPSSSEDEESYPSFSEDDSHSDLSEGKMKHSSSKRRKHKKHYHKASSSRHSKSKHKRSNKENRRKGSSHKRKSIYSSDDSSKETGAELENSSKSKFYSKFVELLTDAEIKKEKEDAPIIPIINVKVEPVSESRVKVEAISSKIQSPSQQHSRRYSQDTNTNDTKSSSPNISVSRHRSHSELKLSNQEEERIEKHSNSKPKYITNVSKSKDASVASLRKKSTEEVGSTLEKISKPKTLTEVSIFPSLEKTSSNSCGSRKSTRDKSYHPSKISSKRKDKNENTSKREPKLNHSITSSDSKTSKHDNTVHHKRESSQSCHRSGDHTSKGSSSERSSGTPKMDSSEKTQKGKGSHDRLKSGSHSKQDYSRRRDSRISTNRKDQGSKQSMKEDGDNNEEDDSKRRKKNKESPRVKRRLSSKEVEEVLAGSDSPIPDLSVLDDLPKEDWDQLLSNREFDAGGRSCENESSSDEGVDYSAQFSIEDTDEDVTNDPVVMEECRRVFSEYNPPEKPQELQKKEARRSVKEESPSDAAPSKVRVAHSGAPGNLIPKPKALIKPRRKTPAEMMLERYRKLKEEEQALQKKLELQRKELERHGKLPCSMVISSSSVSSTSESLGSPPYGVSSSTSVLSKKRVARAPSNVSALLKSKERLKTSTPAEAHVQFPTVATTNAKGSTRVAHIPILETLQRPIVSTEEGTKVPQNIRQRYLNCFVDETLKFCDGEKEAFSVALAEESICHKRATTRMVYLNLAVNIIKKLRSFQISEAALELLENNPKFGGRTPKTITSPQVSSSAKKPYEQHPINPNHRTVSHFSVMASGGQKGTWSIQRPKKSLPDNIQEYLTGNKLYNSLKKYIMTTEQLEENGFPRADPFAKGKAILKKINSRKKLSPSESERYCDRCSTLYEVDQWGYPVISSSCAYHWGRPYKRRGFGGLETHYSCCQGDSQSDGCCLGTTHVSENFSPHSLKGYVRTVPKEPKNDGDFGVYALDCEMCYTTAGSELTRITVADSHNKSVYETFVKPDNPIIDYNTRFSGVTAEDLEDVTVTLRDVQAALLTRFSEKTILIGHSLESDFSAIKLIHDSVVDTSVVFPHKLGPPFKRALRNLASEYLSKIIQNDDGGHDSAEDAITCMELMQWRVKEDLKGHTL